MLAGLPPDAPAGDKELYIDALIARMRDAAGHGGYESVLELGLTAKCWPTSATTSRAFGVEFEHWSSERALAQAGAVERTLERLARLGQTYDQGRRAVAAHQRASATARIACWCAPTAQQTYFAPDLAYHLDKRARGFELMIDVWGADHHGYVARMRAGLVALGEHGDCFEVCLMQFVSLYRGDEKIPMGKRDGQFVTLRQLREEVGNDVCRLFYLMRSHDQHARFRSRAGQVAQQ